LGKDTLGNGAVSVGRFDPNVDASRTRWKLQTNPILLPFASLLTLRFQRIGSLQHARAKKKEKKRTFKGRNPGYQHHTCLGMAPDEKARIWRQKPRLLVTPCLRRNAKRSDCSYSAFSLEDFEGKLLSVFHAYAPRLQPGLGSQNTPQHAFPTTLNLFPFDQPSPFVSSGRSRRIQRALPRGGSNAFERIRGC
jgi:hypothetical protein